MRCCKCNKKAERKDTVFVPMCGECIREETLTANDLKNIDAVLQDRQSIIMPNEGENTKALIANLRMKIAHELGKITVRVKRNKK